MGVKISGKISDQIKEEDFKKIILAYTVLSPILVLEMRKMGLEEESVEAERNLNSAISTRNIEKLRKELLRWSKLIESKREKS